jgi:hypothetical protein
MMSLAWGCWDTSQIMAMLVAILSRYALCACRSGNLGCMSLLLLLLLLEKGMVGYGISLRQA